MRFRLSILFLATTSYAAAQGLSLADALRLASAKHPSVTAGEAHLAAAQQRTQAAAGARLPKITYNESWMRSNNPVFVFSSLLTQHQFSEANFAIGPLNRPEFLNNFQSQVIVDQVVYDGRQVSSQVKAAELGKTIAEQDVRRTKLDMMAAAVQRYFGLALAMEAEKVAAEAVKSAEADLARAEAVRGAGLATDADVLSIRVHVSAVREAQIRRRSDVEVARAALNEALGLALDTPQTLTTSLSEAKLDALALPEFEKSAREQRPELKQAGLARSIAETQVNAARGGLLPTVGVRGMFEADRQQFVRKGGANWLVGATLNWTLFNGFSNRARIGEASEMARAAKAQEEQAARGVRLQVHQAYANFRSAGERIQVASAAVAMAEESLRIIKNRYEAGLTTVTELLRNETALTEARTRKLAAIHDQRVAAAMLERAAGTLAVDSGSVR